MGNTSFSSFKKELLEWAMQNCRTLVPAVLEPPEEPNLRIEENLGVLLCFIRKVKEELNDALDEIEELVGEIRVLKNKLAEIKQQAEKMVNPPDNVEAK